MNDHKQTTCKDVMTHICDNLGDELNSQKCISIKAHLEKCENCKRYFSSVKTTIEFYKKYNVAISDEAHTRLMECLGLKE